MDLDGATARKAREAGARFTISTDAHAVRQLGMAGFGIGTARRAWLGRDDVLNTRSLNQMLAHLAELRRRAER
jgi:DNA polymerase (family 10)